MIRKAAVKRILLCVVALTLIGVTALALGSRSGVTTINGGRMTVSMSGPSKFFTPTEQDQPGLQKIYSNLGTGTSVYNCCTGWTVSAPGSQVGQNWIAEAFTPTFNAKVTRIKVAVGYVTGTNGVTICLATAAMNCLRTWSKINLPTFGTCCTVEVENDAAGIPVRRGKQYWVVVKTGTHTSDTWDMFNLDNGATGPLASNTGAGWMNQGILQQGAFAVLGTRP